MPFSVGFAAVSDGRDRDRSEPGRTGIRFRTQLIYCGGQNTMTIQVELNAEIEAQLVAEARVQGIPLENVAERLLQEALASRSVPQGNLTLEGFHAMLNALSAGSEGLPN